MMSRPFACGLGSPCPTSTGRSRTRGTCYNCKIMGKLREMARVAAATQLLPVMEGGEELLVGGQAVLEGIMMRSPHAYCISIRKPDGSIALHEEVISRPSERHKIFKLPVFRGLGTLGQAMTLGIKSLKFSTDTLLAEEPKP